MKRRKRILSADEQDLWRHATRDVTPISVAAPAVAPDEKAEGTAPQPRLNALRQPRLSDLLPSAPVGAKPRAVAPPLVGAAPNRQWDRVWKRGEMDIDARIDLHGQTEFQAHRRLTRFIIEAAAVEARRLLVITGKGRDGQGLLKTRLPGWLAEGELRPLVMAVHPAHVKDGGEGAFYVILRRRRG